MDSCVQLPGSNLAQAVETTTKSSLNGWQGPLCHQPAVSGQYLVHTIRTSLYLALSDIALEYKLIICGLLWHEGYANRSQLEIVPPSPFPTFPWCQTGNERKSIVALFLLYQRIKRRLWSSLLSTNSFMSRIWEAKIRYEGRYH